MEHLYILKNTPLFSGVGGGQINSMLGCLCPRKARFVKGSLILAAGEETRSIGIMLSGQAFVYKDDILGRRSVLTVLSPADMFAESFLCAGITSSPVTVEAGDDCDVLLIPFERIIKTCGSCCAHHNALIENMLGIIARKNMALSDKIDHIAKKTTKQKLASYLLLQAAENGLEFSLPFDRQGLADYLCVNRSALSRELSRISDEGILSFKRDRFAIDDLEALEAILCTE